MRYMAISAKVMRCRIGELRLFVSANSLVLLTSQIREAPDSSESLDRLRIMAGTNLGGQIDELRFGTTWTDVVAPAVPEPSAAAVLWIGAARWIRLRIRKFS